MDYKQEYIDTLWCEFHIMPSAENDFRISPNHLHIWPGQEFMFIAIPSLDKSFTCTLFAPSEHFSKLSESPETDLVPFFEEYFPGVVPDLISPKDLERQYIENPHLPLISIKCSPYHFGSSVVILGDAAHAMVPFYGQGMNTGLEDVRVLFDHLDESGVYSSSQGKSASSREETRAKALNAYTQQRAPDASAINDLALENYVEMRASVKSPIYRMRKAIEETVSNYFPRLGWATQYSRVSFSNQRFSEVETAVAKQGAMLETGFALLLGTCIGLGGFLAWRSRHANNSGRSMTQLFLWLATKSEQIGR